MSLAAAWLLFPMVLAALCGGAGLLVDAASGRRLPGPLVIPAGLAAIVVAGGLTTATDATAPITVPLVLLMAALGTGLALPWRFGRPDPACAAVALGTFAVFAAPVVLSGQPTFAGYIKLDDTATWLALTDQVLEHGRNLSGLAPSSYLATLEANLPSGYPIGAFLPFGAAEEIVGGDLAWVFQPYLSFLAASLSLCLWQVLDVFFARWARAVAAFVASQPALLFGYALWGGIKELMAAALIAFAAAAAARVGPRDPRRAGVLLGIPAAALIGALGIGGVAWLAPLLAGWGLFRLARGERARLAGQAVWGAAAGLVLAIPGVLTGGFNPFQSGLTEESELGNLVAPLNPLQALGIWPSGDFRIDPTAGIPTTVLLAIALLCGAIGLWAAWRRRATGLLLLATALPATAAIALVGSPWVDAKALASAAPAALALVMSGAFALLRVDRVVGVALAAVLTAGVLWSNVLAYGGADLAPYDQLAELQQIGHDFAGQGPALMTEFNPYGARHFLRDLDGEAVSELRSRPVPLRSGAYAEKGQYVDTDEIDPNALLEFRTLVLRRSPLRSRPPATYRLVRSGDYYEVWQRPAGTPAVPQRLPLGDRLDPSAVPDCAQAIALGRAAAARNGAARLLAAQHAPTYDATSGKFRLPRSGRYDAWLKGSVRGEVTLEIDGRRVGAARHQLENDGGFVHLGTVLLSSGSHGAALRFGGADLHPGSGGFPRPETGPLLLAPTGEETGQVVSVPADQAVRLCGRRWDWIEVVPLPPPQ